MARLDRIAKGNTTVSHDANGRLQNVRYYATDIVSLKGRKIVLNSGGWHTVTTKERMNQAANVYNLGYYVFQRKYKWFVEFQGKIQEFFDGISLKYNGKI